MASNINSLNINGSYPIAGQDNDSQGFRDNFTNIKTNFTYAQNEISDLQGKVVLTTPLIGANSVNNNFSGTIMSNAQTTGFTETAVDQGTLQGSATFDFSLGSFQKVTTSNSISITLPWTGVPLHVYAKMRLWISVADVAHTITFPGTVTVGAGDISGLSGLVFTAPSAGDYVFELSTEDGGTNSIIRLILSPLSSEPAQIAALQSNVSAINSNITVLQGNITTLNGNITSINSTLGNVVLTNATNIMNGNVISGASKRSTNQGTLSGNVVIDFNAADFAQVTTSGNISLSFVNWPTGSNVYATTRALINLASNAHQVTFPASISSGSGLDNVASGSNVTVAGQTFSTTEAGNWIFEFSTFDAGTTVFIQQLVRP